MHKPILMMLLSLLACKPTGTTQENNQGIPSSSKLDSVPKTTKIRPVSRPATSKEVSGTFLEVQWGDYVHVVVEKNDDLLDFWVRPNVEEDDLYDWEDPDNKGRPVKVHYTDTIAHFSQSIDPVTARFLDDLEFLD